MSARVGGMARRLGWLGAAVLGTTEGEPVSAAQDDPESAVEACVPDPLVARDGRAITTPQQWREQRRPEILELFRAEMYGRAPAPVPVSLESMELEPALEGAAMRRQWTLRYAEDPRATLEVLAYLPAAATEPVPAFLALNFSGNHSVHPDPGIRLSTRWMRGKESEGVVDQRATEAARGSKARRWPVQTLMARGYALVTVYYGDIDPDLDDGFRNGVHGVLDGEPEGERAADAWGSIAGWAWGLSRILDSLAQIPEVDETAVAVLGHSRLGKTALWAGAEDPRFAMVISNDSGCGGAAYSRRRQGETVARINQVFPHWFCRRFHDYGDREEELPLDQHLLIALIAPRPAYVASATEDAWADPVGEFRSTLGADAVYRLLGTEGLPVRTMPPPDTPAQGRLAYHNRSGRHDLHARDWGWYLDFADRHLRGR